MSTINPARALGHRAGQHTRLAQQLQPDTRAHYVYDRIQRTDFVEMHLLGWNPVDPALRHGNALEHRRRFLFHPIRKGAAADQLLDFGEVAGRSE